MSKTQWIALACCYKIFTQGWLADVWCEAAHSATYHNFLEDIRCPCIFYHGAEDTLVDPYCSRYHASRIPDASLKILRGVGHTELPPPIFDEMMAECREKALANRRPGAARGAAIEGRSDLRRRRTDAAP